MSLLGIFSVILLIAKVIDLNADVIEIRSTFARDIVSFMNAPPALLPA